MFICNCYTYITYQFIGISQAYLFHFFEVIKSFHHVVCVMQPRGSLFLNLQDTKALTLIRTFICTNTITSRHVSIYHYYFSAILLQRNVSYNPINFFTHLSTCTPAHQKWTHSEYPLPHLPFLLSSSCAFYSHLPFSLFLLSFHHFPLPSSFSYCLKVTLTDILQASSF